LTAKATDDKGAVTTSAARAITVEGTSVAGNVYYIHSDHLETPREITNEQNQTVWKNPPLTEPFGSTPVDEDPDSDGQTFTFNLRFPGQYYDQETGTHYNYYRDNYRPDFGRYGQSDPIGLAGGINTYGYVRGNPLFFVDMLGLETACKPKPKCNNYSPYVGIRRGRQFLCDADGNPSKAWENAVEERIQRQWEALTPEGKELREAENYLWAYYKVQDGENLSALKYQ
jgi:RHS repeat-associated protein